MNYQSQTLVPSGNFFPSSDELTPTAASLHKRNGRTFQLNNPPHNANDADPRFFDVKGTITHFDCSLDDFDALPIARRLHWIQQFMKQVPAANHWFNNIAGIIEGFVEYGLAEPGSWLSIVDAAILQGIQDGYARSAGLVTGPSVNPGASLWCKFFDALRNPAKDVERINLWGAAETAATNFGVETAAARGLSTNWHEWVFWQTGNIYRRAVASFDGGTRFVENWFRFGLGMGVGMGESNLTFNAAPVLSNGKSRKMDDYWPGSTFVDPRTLWQGRSPVYWFSTTFIWSNRRIPKWS